MVIVGRPSPGPAGRNELQTADGDDPEALAVLADQLRERGRTCWLYEVQPDNSGKRSSVVAGMVTTAARFHVVREWRPYESDPTTGDDHTSTVLNVLIAKVLPCDGIEAELPNWPGTVHPPRGRRAYR
jgi:hypothetical protein